MKLFSNQILAIFGVSYGLFGFGEEHAQAGFGLGEQSHLEQRERLADFIDNILRTLRNEFIYKLGRGWSKNIARNCTGIGSGNCSGICTGNCSGICTGNCSGICS